MTRSGSIMQNYISTFIFVIFVYVRSVSAPVFIVSGKGDFYSISDALKNKNEAQTLVLTAEPSKEEWERLPELDRLERLYIYFHIDSLPSQVAKLPLLKTLEVHSRLAFIPSGLKLLTKLDRAVFYPDDALLPAFFNVAGAWTELRYLEVNNPDLAALPDIIENCSKLETLVIGSSHISAPPFVLSKLKNLKVITLGLSAGYNPAGSIALPRADNITVSVPDENVLSGFLQSLDKNKTKPAYIGIHIESVTGKEFSLPSSLLDFPSVRVLEISSGLADLSAGQCV